MFITNQMLVYEKPMIFVLVINLSFTFINLYKRFNVPKNQKPVENKYQK